MAETNLTLAGAVQKYIQRKWMDMDTAAFRTPVMDGNILMPMTIPENAGQYAELRYIDKMSIIPTSETDSNPKVYAPDADVSGSEIQALSARVYNVPLSVFRGAGQISNLAATTDPVDLVVKLSDAIREHALNTGEKFTTGAFVRGMNAATSIIGSDNIGGAAPSMTICQPFKTIYAGGAANYDGLTSGSLHTMSVYERAAGYLEKNRVPKAFENKFYACFISTNVKLMLMRDPVFNEIVKRHESLVKDTKILGHLCDWGTLRFIVTDFPYTANVAADKITVNGVSVPKRNDSGVVHYSTVLGANAAAALYLGGKTAKRISIKAQDISVTGTSTTCGYTLPFQAGPCNPDYGVNIAGAIDPTDTSLDV